MKNFKKVLAIVLVCLMTISCGITAFAVESGSCGDGATYVINFDSKTLTISGTGKIQDDAFNGSEDRIVSYKDIAAIDNIVIGNGITEIGERTFRGVSAESVTLATSIVKIGESAFQNCKELKNIAIPGNVSEIPSKCFMGCEKLEKVVIDNGVKKIGDNSFSGCTALEDVTISETVESIGLCAFHNCTSVESITVPEGVKHIGNDAFSGDTSLSDISLPKSLETIGFRAFGDCTNLKAVYAGSKHSFRKIKFVYSTGKETTKEKSENEPLFNALEYSETDAFGDFIDTIADAFAALWSSIISFARNIKNAFVSNVSFG